jgi:REP element-mobilizing transposase RayT
MTFPRKKYVKEGQEGVYHCFNRCVRRAFLCGLDPLTKRDYSHRKVLLVNRMRELARIFAIEVCAYAIMSNHYHVIVRVRPDIAAKWSDREVAIRWLTLFPRGSKRQRGPGPVEADIVALSGCEKRIAQLRQRLCSLSWFMGRLNEYIARAANKEDDVKGRFWESRFKCQALLDYAAILACMVYVDLNPLRAGIASTPEESDFASIQQRIRDWHSERMMQTKEIESMSSQEPGCLTETWLCPIESKAERQGILPMTTLEYFDLVDRSGRVLRSDKQGSIDADLEPILLRIGANPEQWGKTISNFGSRFRLAAGHLTSLQQFAKALGKRWLVGVGAAATCFA